MILAQKIAELVKKITPKALAIGVGLVMATAGCGDDNGDPYVPPSNDCDCIETAHLDVGQECPCGKNNCECTEKEWTNIGGIPVYRMPGVTDEQMLDEAIPNFEAAFNVLHPDDKAILSSKIDELHVTTEPGRSYKSVGGKLILSANFGRTEGQMTTVFQNIAWGDLEPELEVTKIKQP